MASIKDAVEESFQDNRAFLKYIIFAIPLYLTYYMYNNENTGALFIFAVIFCIFMLLGFITICSVNVNRNNSQVLPDFNLFMLFKESLGTFFAIIPAVIINSVLPYFITSSFTLPSKTFDIILNIFIWFAFISVIVTTYLLYVREKKFKNAYNLKSISDYGANIMISLIFMIPLILLVNVIFLGPIAYLIILFFGLPNPFFDFICCVFLVFNIAIIGNYLAQIGLETIDMKIQNDKYNNGGSSLF